jgi:murein DD-endopeptidase MepM/ murein hydrolase activator NlpD
MQSQLSALAASPNVQGISESNRLVRASFTVIGLALSFGVADSLLSNAHAADSMQLAALPSLTDAPGPLPSFGSDRSPGAAAVYHTVADGETIWDIANRHGVSIEHIKASNGIAEDQIIQVGQVIKVPPVSVAAASLGGGVNRSAESTNQFSADHVLQRSLSDELENHREPSSVQSISLADFLDGQTPENKATTSAPVSPVSLSDVAITDLAVNSDAEAGSAAEESMATMAASDVEAQTWAQTSEKLATKLSELETYSPEQAVLSAANGTRTHRVAPGDTVGVIARRYDVDPSLLQQSNGIANPNFIVAGDELTIPESVDTTVTSITKTEHLARIRRDIASQMATVPKDGNESASVAIQPAWENLNVEEQQYTDETVESSEPTEAVVGLQLQPSSESTTDISVDPFVVGLLSDVAVATQSQVDATVATALRYAPEDASAETFEASTRKSSETAAVAEETEAIALNPQFVDSADTNRRDDSSLLEEELLAAAPLGSEVYAPIVESPEGRVVSPAMPVLPDRDQYLPEAPNRFEGYIWPAQGVLTSGYGWRWGRMHRGVDIAGPVGTPIYAAGPGVVVKSGWNSGGYGNLVDIRHPDGSMTRYAHNSRLLVNEGQQVRQGQQIAEMGSTGYSTGPHLHFEIHIPDQGTINPIAMLPNR